MREDNQGREEMVKRRKTKKRKPMSTEGEESEGGRMNRMRTRMEEVKKRPKREQEN